MANRTKTHKCTHTLHQGSEEPGDSDVSKLCQTCSYTVLRDDMISLFLRRWYQKTLCRNYSNWGGPGKMSPLFQPDQHPNTQGETQQQPHRQVDVAKIKHLAYKRISHALFIHFTWAWFNASVSNSTQRKKKQAFLDWSDCWPFLRGRWLLIIWTTVAKRIWIKGHHRHLLVNVEISQD